jgi:tetratricopeptide (TPR) repeat protein
MAGRNQIFTIAALTLGLLLASSANAQWTGTGRISGVIAGPDGEPIAGAKITYRLADDPDEGPDPLVTDSDGEFRYAGLKSATWMISVEAEGFLPVPPQRTFVYATRNDPIRIQMELVPEEVVNARKRAKVNERLMKADELRAEGELEAAREEYLEALEDLEVEDHPIVLAALADTYLHEERIEEAREQLKRALEIDPNHVPSLIGMMAILVDEGNFEEANELMARLPTDQEIHPTLMMKLAQGYYNRDHMEEAKAILDRTVRDHPDEAIAYYFRGLTELNLNQTGAARADMLKFLELAPDHAEAEAAKGIIEFLPPQDE